MIRISKKLALAASLTAVVVGLGTGIAFAAADNDDNIAPQNDNFVATSTNIAFKGTVNGVPVTVTCTNSNLNGMTPPIGSGLGPFNINNPFFGNCTDSLSGTDAVRTNAINGSWQLTFIDSAAANEETQAEPNNGDQMQITIPKAGATFTSNILPGCVITAAPIGSVNISGAYDDVNTLKFSGASIPVSGAGCSASSSAITGSYKSGLNIQDVS